MVYEAKFTEVCKYVITVNEFLQANTFTINAKRWNSFSVSTDTAREGIPWAAPSKAAPTVPEIVTPVPTFSP
jgi:hypothetical protein